MYKYVITKQSRSFVLPPLMIAEIHIEIGSTEVTGDYMHTCTQKATSIHASTSKTHTHTHTILNALGIINQFDQNIQDQSVDISLHINKHIQISLV